MQWHTNLFMTTLHNHIQDFFLVRQTLLCQQVSKSVSRISASRKAHQTCVLKARLLYRLNPATKVFMREKTISSFHGMFPCLQPIAQLVVLYHLLKYLPTDYT